MPSDIHDTGSAANELWMKLTNDATHNAAVIVLAQAPETVRAIVVKRCADAAEPFYRSAAGKREAEELEDWLSLDDGSFQTDKAERTSAQ